MRIQHNQQKKTECIIGPAVAVDTLIFTVREDTLSVLLIKIGSGSYKNKWALPGGVVQINETLDQAAHAVLEKKAGVRGVYLEQLHSFSDIDRDVRGRMISVAYFALVDSSDFTLKTMDYYADIAWHDVRKLPQMAFDHKKIIAYGIDRLRAKIEYSNIVYALLPQYFTLTQMQNIYEIILGKKIDKRNFRKKIFALDLLRETKKTTTDTPYRPARLYAFKKRELRFIK